VAELNERGGHVIGMASRIDRYAARGVDEVAGRGDIGKVGGHQVHHHESREQYHKVEAACLIKC